MHGTTFGNGLRLGLDGLNLEPRTTPTSQFRPSLVPGLATWVSAKNPLGNGSLPSQGQVLTSLVDQSGNGRNFATPEATPSIEMAGINGLPAVFFDGTESLKTSGLALVSPYTILYVSRLAGTINKRVLGGDANRLIGYWSGTSPAPAGDFEHSLFLTTNIHLNLPPARPATTAVHIYSLVTNGTAKKFRDGQTVISNTTSNTDTGFGDVWLGRSGFGERSACFIGEVLVYRAALDDATIAKVIGYLQTQWL